MDEKMVCVPYGDFVDGVMAQADLELIRAMITDGGEYCSKGVRAALGLPKEERDAQEVEGCRP